MFEREYKNFLNFFRIYGILPENQRKSFYIAIFWLSMSGFYIWWGIKIDMMSTYWLISVKDVMYFANYIGIFITEIIVLISSLSNSKVYEKLYISLSSIDQGLTNNFNIKLNYKQIRTKNLRKIIFILIYTLFMMSTVYMYYYEYPETCIEWLATMIVEHMIHVKIISVIFFIDLVNERLKILIKLSKKENFDVTKFNKIYKKVFTSTRLIHKIYGKTMSLIIPVYCVTCINGIYCLFLKLAFKDEHYGYLDICCGTLCDGFMIIMICKCTQKLEKLGKILNGIILKSETRQKRKIDQFHQLEKLSIECLLNKISFNGIGSLHINNRMFVKILSIASPFLIIIIQFEIDEKK